MLLKLAKIFVVVFLFAIAGSQDRLPRAAQGEHREDQGGRQEAGQLDRFGQAVLRGKAVRFAGEQLSPQKPATKRQQTFVFLTAHQGDATVGAELRQGQIGARRRQGDGVPGGAGPRREVHAGHGLSGDADARDDPSQREPERVHRDAERDADQRAEAGGGQQQGGEAALAAARRDSRFEVSLTFDSARWVGCERCGSCQAQGWHLFFTFIIVVFLFVCSLEIRRNLLIMSFLAYQNQLLFA